MIDYPGKKAYELEAYAKQNLHLMAEAKTPVLERVKPVKYSRLSLKQKREIVQKLIEYLKTA